MTFLMIAASSLLVLLAVLIYVLCGLKVAHDAYVEYDDPVFYMIVVFWPVLVVCGILYAVCSSVFEHMGK